MRSTHFLFIHFYIYFFAELILFWYIDYFMMEVKTIFLQINNIQGEV
jgi:hypothetical protein